MDWQSFLGFDHVPMRLFLRTVPGEEVAQHIVHQNSSLVQVRVPQQIMHLVKNQIDAHGMLKVLGSLGIDQQLWV
jgi:hypothetical protein